VDGTFPLGTYAEDYEYTGTVGDLDEYNGRLCVTPDYPNGTYAYFVTTDSNGDPAFPYIMGPTYYGVVSNADIGPNAGNASIPAGVSCGTISEIQNMDMSTDPGLYPNPFIDQFTITIADNLSDYTLNLYNLQGQLVKEIGWGSDQSRIQIDARDLKGGTYYLQIKSKGKLYRSPVRIFKL
jgi:hypothetical protein